MFSSIDYKKREYLLCEIVRNKPQGYFGKTKLQKYVYFLQEMYGIDTGYDYSIYTYGPYSGELSSDLDSFIESGILSVEKVEAGNYRGIDLTVNKNSCSTERIKNDKIDEGLNQLLEIFADKNASELGILATIKFASNDYPDYSKEKILNLVKEIKSTYSSEMIETQLDYLLEKKIIAFN